MSTTPPLFISLGLPSRERADWIALANATGIPVDVTAWSNRTSVPQNWDSQDPNYESLKKICASVSPFFSIEKGKRGQWFINYESAEEKKTSERSEAKDNQADIIHNKPKRKIAVHYFGTKCPSNAELVSLAKFNKGVSSTHILKFFIPKNVMPSTSSSSLFIKSIEEHNPFYCALDNLNPNFRHLFADLCEKGGDDAEKLLDKGLIYLSWTHAAKLSTVLDALKQDLPPDEILSLTRKKNSNPEDEKWLHNQVNETVDPKQSIVSSANPQLISASEKELPKIIHYIWFGKAIPNDRLQSGCGMISKAIASKYKVIIWCDNEAIIRKSLFSKDIPDEIVDRIEFKDYRDLENEYYKLFKTDSKDPLKRWSEICPPIARELVGHKNYASASDIARVLALYTQSGGYYFDWDIGIAPLPGTIEKKLRGWKTKAQLLIPKYTKVYIGNDMLAAQPSNPVLFNFLKRFRILYAHWSSTKGHRWDPSIFLMDAKRSLGISSAIERKTARLNDTIKITGPKALQMLVKAAPYDGLVQGFRSRPSKFFDMNENGMPGQSKYLLFEGVPLKRGTAGDWMRHSNYEVWPRAVDDMELCRRNRPGSSHAYTSDSEAFQKLAADQKSLSTSSSAAASEAIQ